MLSTEALGPKIRRQRRRLGLTLDELAGRTAISKPYLSLIETGRVPNPPSDEKLRRLEQTLGFTPGELVSQAHLQRTPRDVRAVLQRLMEEGKAGRGGGEGRGDAGTRGRGEGERDCKVQSANGKVQSEGESAASASNAISATAPTEISNLKSDIPHPSFPASPRPRVPASSPSPSSDAPIDLDAAYLSGMLQELVERSVGNVEQVKANAVPVINRVSAGYPKDFSDMGYPPRVADEYVSCPDVSDRDAFAARVHGDSMTPKYRQGDIVIFSPALPPREGDDCFVRFADGQTTFKRVFFEADESGHPLLRLQPRNEKYRPQTIPSQDVAGLYKAIYRYQRVDED
ncbi:MAG TPA: XRE family transcriptional regulator [Tepidisphaeraceae bacterium]|jgi:phage repressor protein C with HTH and peptisase S24 domain/transcriptional regulator with XRE-family HTH domain|nr:XRE family transcriptional regulator [Tepidisphaeraceae bacterium]